MNTPAVHADVKVPSVRTIQKIIKDLHDQERAIGMVRLGYGAFRPEAIEALVEGGDEMTTVVLASGKEWAIPFSLSQVMAALERHAKPPRASRNA